MGQDRIRSTRRCCASSSHFACHGSHFKVAVERGAEQDLFGQRLLGSNGYWTGTVERLYSPRRLAS